MSARMIDMVTAIEAVDGGRFEFSLARGCLEGDIEGHIDSDGQREDYIIGGLVSSFGWRVIASYGLGYGLVRWELQPQ